MPVSWEWRGFGIEYDHDPNNDALTEETLVQIHPGESVQRIIYRFDVVGTSEGVGIGKILQPRSDYVRTRLAFGSHLGTTRILERRFSAPALTYLRSSDTNLNAFQLWQGRYEPIYMDIQLRSKNTSTAGEDDNVILIVDWIPGNGVPLVDVMPLQVIGEQQLMVLVSKPGS